MTSLASAQVDRLGCPEVIAEVYQPPPDVDTIIVNQGTSYGWTFASLNANGRAFLLQDFSRPREAKVASVVPSEFFRLLEQVRDAAEADRDRPPRERKQVDSTTLEGLLEAVREGSRVCEAEPDGTMRNVRIVIGGEETGHYCVDGKLAEFTEAFLGVIAEAIDESGEFLCR